MDGPLGVDRSLNRALGQQCEKRPLLAVTNGAAIVIEVEQSDGKFKLEHVVEPPNMTFLEYLAKRRITAGPAGDFTRDARKDPGMSEIESWPQLQAYLFRQATGRRVKDIVEAAEPVWKGYRSHVLKNRRENPSR
jgi:hypothetical protein